MLDDLHPLLPALIAVLPASLIWWRSRALMRAPDDPALPERLVAKQRLNGTVTGVAVSLLIFGWPSTLVWSGPVLVIAVLAATFPLRKALYGETWSLGAYLLFLLRLVLVVGGFWIALAVLPMIAWSAGRHDWIVAILLGVGLLAWNRRHPTVVRRLMRSEPLGDARLLERFTLLARASDARAPSFERVDLRGGVIVNAFALPSVREPAVLFTDTLLARLEEDEAAAICAHELAHLEYYDHARLRHLDRLTLVLIATAVCLAPLVRLTGAPLLVTAVVWIGGLVGVLLYIAKDRQRNETAADRRAVALTQDPEALVSSLTKLHAFARLPRRVDQVTEGRATHPSLARRIRDIRAAGGIAPVALADAASLTTPDGLVTVTFDNDGVRWQRGEAVPESVAYADLIELRVHATRRTMCLVE